MVSPVVLLKVGVGLAPLSPALADHLGVLGIDLALMASVVTAPPGLTFQPATHRLIGTARGRSKSLGQQRGGKLTSSEVWLGPNLEETRSGGVPRGHDLEFLPRPRQWAVSLSVRPTAMGVSRQCTVRLLERQWL